VAPGALKNKHQGEAETEQARECRQQHIEV